MRPRLTFVLFKHLGQESPIYRLTRFDSCQANGKTALLLKGVQPLHGIWMVLGNEFKPILKGHDNRSIHPWRRCFPQRIDEFPV